MPSTPNGQDHSRATANEIEEYVRSCLQSRTTPKSGSMINMLVSGVEAGITFFCIHETDELIYYDAELHRYIPQGSIKVNGFCEGVVRHAGAVPFIHKTAMSEVEGHIRRNAYVPLEEFENEEQQYIPLANGVYDLQTKELLPYSQDFRFLNVLAVEYRPEAVCPNFEKFLDGICIDSEGQPDAAMRKAIIQLFAYCLWRGYPIQKIFFLIGGGANGKGVLLGTLQAFLGNENVANRSILSLGDNRFAGADLYRKYANISNELTVDELKNVDLIKSLCSGTDYVSAERKFQQPFNFKNYAKIVIATNAPPKTNDATDGFFRRLNLIQFSKQFIGTDDNRSLPNLLKESSELSGILNLALRELEAWLLDGEIGPNSEMANEKSIAEVRELYERLADSIAAYRYDALDMTGEEEDYITKDRIFMEYRDYCKVKKIAAHNEAKFWKEFRAYTLGMVQDKRMGENKIRCLTGLKFKDWKVSRYPSVLTPQPMQEINNIGRSSKLTGYLDTNTEDVDIDENMGEE